MYWDCDSAQDFQMERLLREHLKCTIETYFGNKNVFVVYIKSDYAEDLQDTLASQISRKMKKIPYQQSIRLTSSEIHCQGTVPL